MIVIAGGSWHGVDYSFAYDPQDVRPDYEKEKDGFEKVIFGTHELYQEEADD